MIIALNNKCNLGKDDFLCYQEELREVGTDNQLIVCPTFLNINLYNLEFPLGAQNVSSKEEGAHTGEISAEDLNQSNVRYCIVGHSERRQELNETEEEINEKIKRLQEHNITPILCVGETKEEREQELIAEVIGRELLSATKDVDLENLIIAYEPIWSIGTGLTPTNDEIKEVIEFIKHVFPDIPVLYGGSANEKNIDTLKEVPNIDGYLVGGLSLKVPQLKEFLNKLD